MANKKAVKGKLLTRARWWVLRTARYRRRITQPYYSLVAVVFFRHLPEIDQGADTWLMRGLQHAASLFTLFCVTLELERLGRTLGSRQQD